MARLVAGFVGPPGWHDPSPREFTSITGVPAIGASLDLGAFDWDLDRIATTEPEIAEAAAGLAERGATVVGIVGTPFGWAGLQAADRPHDRNERLASWCGVPVVSAVAGVLDWLARLGARRVALAATYYDAEWCERWERFVAAAGYAVTSCSSMADLGIVDGPLDAADETHWTPSSGQIEATVLGVLHSAPADAVVVSGAGARTLDRYDRLCDRAGVPVVSVDLALYRSVILSSGLTSGPVVRRDRRLPSWWPPVGVGA